jgi:3D (Asp-Asp-Asp) domain-containing protein
MQMKKWFAMALAGLLAVLGSVFVGGGSASAETTPTVYMTFYAAYDNDPPGSCEIANTTWRSCAGGTGTYADPVTIAADPARHAYGTIIYIPRLHKYGRVEDYCAGCIGSSQIDVYMGSANEAPVEQCEALLTDTVLIRKNPASTTYAVNSGALYSTSGGRCGYVYFK